MHKHLNKRILIKIPYLLLFIIYYMSQIKYFKNLKDLNQSNMIKFFDFCVIDVWQFSSFCPEFHHFQIYWFKYTIFAEVRFKMKYQPFFSLFFLQKQQAFNVSHLSFFAILKRKFHLPRAKRMKIFFLFNFQQIYTYRQQIFRIEIFLVETLNSNRIVSFAHGKNIDS